MIDKVYNWTAWPGIIALFLLLMMGEDIRAFSPVAFCLLYLLLFVAMATGRISMDRKRDRSIAYKAIEAYKAETRLLT